MVIPSPGVLLIGPYDPHCGEYTFLAPPLGVWRLAGVLEAAGVRTAVFDPNCCTGPPQRALEREILRGGWDVIELGQCVLAGRELYRKKSVRGESHRPA